MMENFLHAGNLGYHLFGRRYDVVRSTLNPGFSGSYLPGEIFLRHIAHETARTVRFRQALQVDSNGLLFVPMNQSLSAKAYRYGMHAVIDSRIDQITEQVDDLFLHLEPNGNDTTAELLERSDIVLVCLPATIDDFSAFYDRYRSMLGKCFFVFYGSSRSPEPMLLRMQKLLPHHTMRCCYLEITRILHRYMEDGRVLDYLDSYGGKEDFLPVGARVAESARAYSALPEASAADMENYRRWKESFRQEMYAYENRADARTASRGADAEQESVRSIRYISEWLMQHEYPDAQGDCVLIAQRMLRRQVMPEEVAEWEMMRFAERETTAEQESELEFAQKI